MRSCPARTLSGLWQGARLGRISNAGRDQCGRGALGLASQEESSAPSRFPALAETLQPSSTQSISRPSRRGWSSSG